VVSISGCDPLDPGSNPGTAILFLVFVWRRRKKKNRFYRDLNPDYKDQNLGS
jgi:hypothetical protein